MPFDPVSYPQPPRAACETAPPAAPRTRALAVPVLGLIGRVLARHAAIRQLRRLDDRLLRDVGIERPGIADAIDTMMAGAAAPGACDRTLRAR